MSGAIDPHAQLGRIPLCELDDFNLVGCVLNGEPEASRELMRRYNPALHEAARDANERLSDREIDALVAELWRSLTDDHMHALRTFTPAHGALLSTWLTVRLARLALAPREVHQEEREISQPTLMGVEEVAERWGVDRKTIYSMITRGKIPARRCGRLVKIPRNIVESFELQASVSPEGTIPCR